MKHTLRPSSSNHNKIETDLFKKLEEYEHTGKTKAKKGIRSVKDING